MDSTLYDILLIVIGFGIFETIMGFLVVPRVTLWWILRNVDLLIAEFETIADERKLWEKIRQHVINGALGGTGGRPPNLVAAAKTIGVQLAQQWLSAKVGGMMSQVRPPPPPPVA